MPYIDSLGQVELGSKKWIIHVINNEWNPVMRTSLIEKIKSDIELALRNYLREEGIELYIAANDNFISSKTPAVALESIEDRPLEGSLLLSEIKIILGILGKPWQCDALVDGIYAALHPHYITHRELTVLLMSLHVETIHCVRPRHLKKRTVMRYIVEETPPRASTDDTDISNPNAEKIEYC